MRQSDMKRCVSCGLELIFSPRGGERATMTCCTGLFPNSECGLEIFGFSNASDNVDHPATLPVTIAAGNMNGGVVVFKCHDVDW